MGERKEVLRDFAYGMVFLRKVADGGYQVLMVRNWREEWGLPKGHANDGEDPREAAEREGHEETGLWPDWVIKEGVESNYSFIGGEGWVEKTVVYYLGGVNDGQLDGWQGKGEDGREIKECVWCSFEEARNLASFETTRGVLGEVEKEMMGF
jgi:8-oxo-dGTP pyrophosphatase MutT (NUDIX family)